MAICVICSATELTRQCACTMFGYCSVQCATVHWLGGHALQCPSVVKEAPAIGETVAQTRLYDLLNTSDFDAVDPAMVKDAFARAYPPQNFPYLVQHYDRCGSQRLLLLDPTGKWAMGSFTSMQRLAREFLGPWSRKRGHIISAPTGAGKTVIGHAIAGNYRYERITLNNPVVNDESEKLQLHRTILYVTRTTLVRDVKKALWAQTSSNLASIHKRTKEAGLDVFPLDQPAPFSTEINVVSFKTFTNMLSGSNPQGRRLWAGLPINSRQDPKLPGYRAAPNAYRLVNNKWVRGGAPHSLATKRSDAVYDLVLVWRRGVMQKLERGGDGLLKSFATKLAKEWNKKSRKSANLPDIPSGGTTATIVGTAASPRVYITVQFKDNKPPPLDDEWATWASNVDFVLADEYGTRQSDAYTFFKENEEKLIRLEPGIQEDAGPSGYALRRQANGILVWEPTNEPEIDFNPLDAVQVMLDEADMAFDPRKIRAGERGNAHLLGTSKEESQGMVMISMSATIDLPALLGLTRTIIPKYPGGDLAPSLPYPSIPVISDAQNLTWPETIQQLGDLYDVENRQLNMHKLREIEKALRGSVSAMTVDKMLDLFPKFDPRESRQLNVLLGQEHSRRIIEAFESRPKVSAARLEHTVAFATSVLKQQWRIGSSVFDVDSVADALVLGRNGAEPLFPVALPLLEALRSDDEEELEFYRSRGLSHLRPAKRAIICSLESDDFGVVPSTSSMQAAGYRWLPIVRQETKLKRLQREVFENPSNRDKQEQLTALKRKLAEKRRLGILPDKHKTVRVLEEQPFQMFNEALAKRVGPVDDRKNVLVLSTSLSWDRDPTLKEPDTLQDLVDFALNSGTFDTKFVFASAKHLREELKVVDRPNETAEEHKAREDAKKEVIRTIKDHKVYFWPGSGNPQLNGDLFSRDDMDALSKAFGERAGLFIRKVPGIDDEEDTGRTLRYLEPSPVRLEDFGIDLNTLDARDSIVPLKLVAEFNTRLSREEMLDAADIVQRLWNSEKNVHGDVARYIVVSAAFNQGVDLNGITKAYNLGPAKSRTSELQRRGRYIRRCSAVGLHYPEQWQVRSSTFVTQLQDDERSSLTYGAVMGRRLLEEEEEEFEEEYARHRQERGVIQSIELNPLDTPNAPPYGDAQEPLVPYQAIRLRTEDPSVAALRLEGSKLIQRWAIDQKHNEIGLDAELDRRYAFTNYRLIRSQIQLLLDYLPAPEPLPTSEDFTINGAAATAIVLRRAAALGIPIPANASMFDALILLGQVRERGTEDDALRNYFSDLLETFGDEDALLILRRLAEDKEERNLYLSLSTSRAPLRRPGIDTEVMLEPQLFNLALSDPQWTGTLDNFLLYLVQNRFAVAAPIFKALSEKPGTRPKRKGDTSDPSESKRTKSEPSEDLDASIMMAIPICNGFIGDEDEAGTTVGTELESPATPDQDQELIETVAVEFVQTTLEAMHLWRPGESLAPEKYATRIVKRVTWTGDKEPSKAEKVTTLKKVLVELYSVGFMNWNIAIELLYNLLDTVDKFSLDDIKKLGKILGMLFRLAFYHTADFVGAFNASFDIPPDFYSKGKTPTSLMRFVEVLLVWTLPYQEKAPTTFNLPLIPAVDHPGSEFVLLNFLQSIEDNLYLRVPDMLFRATKPLTEAILKQTVDEKLSARHAPPDVVEVSDELGRRSVRLQLLDTAPELYDNYLTIVKETAGDFESAKLRSDPDYVRKGEYARLLLIDSGRPNLSLSTTEMLVAFALAHREHTDRYAYFNSIYTAAQRVAEGREIRDVVREIVAALPELDERNAEQWRRNLLTALENKVGLSNYRETGFKTKKKLVGKRLHIVVSEQPFRDFKPLQPFYIVDGTTPTRILQKKSKIVEELYDVYKNLKYKYKNDQVEMLHPSFVERLVADIAHWMSIPMHEMNDIMIALTGDGGEQELRKNWAKLVAKFGKHRKLKLAIQSIALDVPNAEARTEAFRKLMSAEFKLERWTVLSQVLAVLELGVPSRYVHFPDTQNLKFQPAKLNIEIGKVLAVVSGAALSEKTVAERTFTRYIEKLYEVYGGAAQPATRKSALFTDLVAYVRDRVENPAPTESTVPLKRELMAGFFDKHIARLRRELLDISDITPIVPTTIPTELGIIHDAATPTLPLASSTQTVSPIFAEPKTDLNLFDAPAVVDKCRRCRKITSMQYCACEKVGYCGEKCQRIDWSNHKAECTWKPE